jgi:hypothetical protein
MSSADAMSVRSLLPGSARRKVPLPGHIQEFI